MKRIKIKVIKILLKALTDENYAVVSLDEWNENTFENYNRGIEKGIEMAIKAIDEKWHDENQTKNC